MIRMQTIISQLSLAADRQTAEKLGSSGTTSAPARSWLDRVWSFFASPKVAFALILIIAGATAIGVALVQAPESARTDSAAFARWLTQVRPKYGAATDVLSALGLFTIFSSGWFRLLIALLAALHGSGAAPLGPNGWRGLGAALLGGGAALIFLPDWIWGKYTGRK